MNEMNEAKLKIENIRKWYTERGLDAIVLSQPSNFAYATDGGRSDIGLAQNKGRAWLFISNKQKVVVANNIEAPRIFDEELAGQDYEVTQYPWYQEDQKSEIISQLASGLRVASDDGVAGLPNVGDEFAKLRYVLSPADQEKFIILGKSTSEALAHVCRTVKPGQTEYDIAAQLLSVLLPQGISPAALLVATDERAFKYRHPVLTNKKLEKHLMVVVSSQRHGLVASATRLVHFGPLPDELRKRHEAVVKVDAAFIGNSRPGEVVGEIFAAAQKVYAETGYADEWQRHHQGGPTGYAGRDYKGTPGESQQLQLHQAIAWNPSIAGTKSEDTIIVMEDKPLIITKSADWPAISVEYNGNVYDRPDILIR